MQAIMEAVKPSRKPHVSDLKPKTHKETMALWYQTPVVSLRFVPTREKPSYHLNSH
jgi:hypothetical protein